MFWTGKFYLINWGSHKALSFPSNSPDCWVVPSCLWGCLSSPTMAACREGTELSAPQETGQLKRRRRMAVALRGRAKSLGLRSDGMRPGQALLLRLHLGALPRETGPMGIGDGGGGGGEERALDVVGPHTGPHDSQQRALPTTLGAGNESTRSQGCEFCCRFNLLLFDIQ